jgi:transposase
MSNEQILLTYLKLTNIESVFRSIKNELGLRPNFHKKNVIIQHILMSLLAYQIVNYIRIKMKMEVFTIWNTIRYNSKEQKYSKI